MYGSSFIFFTLFSENISGQYGWYDNFGLRKYIANYLTSLYNNHQLLYYFTNPAHRVSDLEKFTANGQLTTMQYLVSFIARVLVAWFLYEFVAAFRQFRKSI